MWHFGRPPPPHALFGDSVKYFWTAPKVKTIVQSNFNQRPKV